MIEISTSSFEPPKNNKRRLIIIIVSLFVIIGLVICAVLFQNTLKSLLPSNASPSNDAKDPIYLLDKVEAPSFSCDKTSDCTNIPLAADSFIAAERPDDASIDYIIMHCTEETYEDTIDITQDPENDSSWHFTVGQDGQIAQHLPLKDIGFHAGNLWFNLHSIGVENVCFGGDGNSFSEEMYTSSANLVENLAMQYNIPLDRAHILAHDQLPAVAEGKTVEMHNDPGPEFDWDLLFELMGAPIAEKDEVTSKVKVGDIVQFDFAYAECGDSADCLELNTNIWWAYTEIVDGYHGEYSDFLINNPSTGETSTFDWQDGSAKIPAGHLAYIADVKGNWVAIWFAGQLAWVEAGDFSPIFKIIGHEGDADLPVKVVTFNEETQLYGAAAPLDTISPIEYTIPAQQKYIVQSSIIPATYIKFDDNEEAIFTHSNDMFYQLHYGHRLAFVNVDDAER